MSGAAIGEIGSSKARLTSIWTIRHPCRQGTGMGGFRSGNCGVRSGCGRVASGWSSQTAYSSIQRF